MSQPTTLRLTDRDVRDMAISVSASPSPCRPPAMPAPPT